MDEGVDDGLTVCGHVEKHHFLPLDMAVPLVCLRHVEHFSIIKHAVKSHQQANIAEFTHGIQGGSLRLAVEQRKTDGNV